MLVDIQVEYCRQRQRRLLEEMDRQGLDWFIATSTEHVQYLAGPRYAWTFRPMFALRADGQSLLVAPAETPVAAADKVVVYETNKLFTMRNDQSASASETLLASLAAWPRPRRIGVEKGSFPPHVGEFLNVELHDLEPYLYVLRRKKDPDELARLRVAIEATGAMYRRAREIIRPGVSELRVFNELQAAAVESCGEMITGTGNDYACAVLGGPPRTREAQAGELYILDLGPAYRGYFADNARTIAVDGRPTADQQAAWSVVAEIFDLVREMVRPGASCRALYDAAVKHIGACQIGKWHAHLGHGIGLFPHEAPHINPHWDDTFEEGEVIAVEPGIYDENRLRHGIRLENDYLVTADGVELLSDFPLELA